MDIEKIREFLVFYDHMNFTTAAKELNTTQSTLSKHVADMERELGGPLLIRGAASIPNRLTKAGEEFIKEAPLVLEAYDRLRARCQMAAPSIPPIRIHNVLCDINLGGPLGRTVKELWGEGASSQVLEFKKVTSGIQESLDNGAVDAAVHYEASDAMDVHITESLSETYRWTRLPAEPICVMADAAHPLAAANNIPLERLGSLDVVNLRSASYTSWYNAVEQLCHQLGWNIRWRLVPENARDDGSFNIEPPSICIGTEKFFAYNKTLGMQDLVRLDIVDFNPRVHPFLVYRCDNPNPRLHQLMERL